MSILIRRYCQVQNLHWQPRLQRSWDLWKVKVKLQTTIKQSLVSF